MTLSEIVGKQYASIWESLILIDQDWITTNIDDLIDTSVLPRDYLTLTLDNIVYKHTLLNPTVIDLLLMRIWIDGSTNYSQVHCRRKKLQEININLQTDIYNKLPNKLRQCIFDCDTDGLQCTNIYKFDAECVRQQLNLYIAQIFQLDNIIFEGKYPRDVLCLTKKKYTVYNEMPLLGGFTTDDRIQLKNVRISHSGYERNALPCFKHLCNYMAALCFYMKKKIVPIYTFKQIIFSFFFLFTIIAAGRCLLVNCHE
nr:hypothetical protein [Microctonus hyperodae filamentous virus]